MTQTDTHTQTQSMTTPPSRSRLPSWWSVLILLGGLLGVLVLGLPLVGLFWRGLSAGGWYGLAVDGVSTAAALTLLTTGLSLLITVTLGTPLAYALARWQFPLKRLLNVLVELPIVMPPAVAGLALLVTFGRRGMLGGVLDGLGVSIPFTTAAVILAQTFVSMPFYVRSAVVGLLAVPREIEEAAQVDGASSQETFWWVTLPLASRAIAAGLLLSWARAVGEFGATLLFAGNLQGRTQTMPLLIQATLERDINAAVWTGILLVFMALTALGLSRLLMREG